MPSEELHLSVILCTWNNAARLRITLDAISVCVVPEGLRWELVIVNNNCTDATDAVVHAFEHCLPIRYVRQAMPGLSGARNAGLAAARGAFVVFTDDDVRPFAEWLTAYWEGYQRYPKGHYFGGPLESEFEGEPPGEIVLRYAPWSVKGLDWGGVEVVGPELKFVSANWGCPRVALDSVGGFDPSLGLVGGSREVRVGEESDLMNRLQGAGWLPCYLPRARLRHFVPVSKVSVRHIAERAQAYGVIASRNQYGKAGGRMTYCRRMYPRARQLVTAALGWVWAQVRGRNADAHYIRLRRLWGEISSAAHCLARNAR
jgi:glucosyl-dolichyl phosphate glucuronosyltransferase